MNQYLIITQLWTKSTYSKQHDCFVSLGKSKLDSIHDLNRLLELGLIQSKPSYLTKDFELIELNSKPIINKGYELYQVNNDSTLTRLEANYDTTD